MIGETPDRPVNVRLIAADANMGKLILLVLLSLAPVAVAILMQNPALRQAIQMRFWKKAEVISTTAAGHFDKAAQGFKLKYDLARM